jgi:hypothetical protein
MKNKQKEWHHVTKHLIIVHEKLHNPPTHSGINNRLDLIIGPVLTIKRSTGYQCWCMYVKTRIHFLGTFGMRDAKKGGDRKCCVGCGGALALVELGGGMRAVQVSSNVGLAVVPC